MAITGARAVGGGGGDRLLELVVVACVGRLADPVGGRGGGHDLEGVRVGADGAVHALPVRGRGRCRDLELRRGAADDASALSIVEPGRGRALPLVVGIALGDRITDLRPKATIPPAPPQHRHQSARVQK